MRFFTKSNIVFLACILLSTVFSSTCLAAKYQEKGLRAIPLVSGGKITGVKIMINAANGGPKINILQLNYPGSTILITTASLTVRKGFYQIELLEKGKPSLVLRGRDGKTVKGDDRLSVSAGGALQYTVTAKKAKDVVLNLSFSPVPDKPRVSQTSSEEKLSYGGDGLSLKLNCVAGKNCSLQVQNMSRSKAYRNILFRIDYKKMMGENSVEKSKSGGIEDVLLPDKTGEWSLDLVFGEPPKDMKVSLIKADAVDPASMPASNVDQQKSTIIPLIPLEKQKGNDITAFPSTPALAPDKTSSAPAVRTIKALQITKSPAI